MQEPRECAATEGGVRVRYKEVGQTCGQLAEVIKKETGAQEICYAGRLDPMAHGMMTFLLGNEVKKMEEYNGRDKTYEVTIVAGVQTDTDDVLGVLEHIPSVVHNNLVEIIKSMPREYEQKYHCFSSFKPAQKYTDGKRYPLWWWTKNGVQMEQPTKKVYIRDDIFVMSVWAVDGRTFKDDTIAKVSELSDEVAGEFRKTEILKQWNQFQPDWEYTCVRLRLRVSSGFYVRQFVRDVSLLAGPLLAYDIHRTEI